MSIDDSDDTVDGDADKDQRKPEEENQRNFSAERSVLKCFFLSFGNRTAAYRFNGMADFMTIGIGKQTSRRSVMTSLEPIVIS